MPQVTQPTPGGHVGLTVADQEKIKSIVATIKTYLFTEVYLKKVETIVIEAYEDNDKNFTIREAAEWGAGFTIPRGVVEATTVG